MSATKQDEERILFYIFLECLCQQIEMLQGHEKHNAKKWLNQLIQLSRKTLDEMRKNMDPTTQAMFEDMYDFFYMTMRDAAKVHGEDVNEFRKLVSEFIKHKYPQGESSLFKPKTEHV